jgi:hypothetical protein
MNMSPSAFRPFRAAILLAAPLVAIALSGCSFGRGCAKLYGAEPRIEGRIGGSPEIATGEYDVYSRGTSTLVGIVCVPVATTQYWAMTDDFDTDPLGSSPSVGDGVDIKMTNSSCGDDWGTFQVRACTKFSGRHLRLRNETISYTQTEVNCQ